MGKSTDTEEEEDDDDEGMLVVYELMLTIVNVNCFLYRRKKEKR